MKLRDVWAEKMANTFEEEAPEHSWRETYAAGIPHVQRGADVRFARKNPGLWLLSKAFDTTKKEAVAKLAAVREMLKEGGDWEGSGSAGVYAMTPKALGISGGGLGGGPGMLQGLSSMQFRPTLGSGGFGSGFSGMAFGGGGVQPLIDNYRAVAMGGGVPW